MLLSYRFLRICAFGAPRQSPESRRTFDCLFPAESLILAAMKLALAQINTTVGDIAGNERKILAAYQRGVAAGVEVVLTPELGIVGYPPRDLLLKNSFIPVNLAALNQFDEGARVDEIALRALGLANGRAAGIKILGNGKLTRKLVVVANRFSAQARTAIESLGGTCELVPVKAAVKS